MAEIIITDEIIKQMVKSCENCVERVSEITKNFVDQVIDMAEQTGYSPYEKFLGEFIEDLNDWIVKSAWWAYRFGVDEGNYADHTSFTGIEKMKINGVTVIQGEAVGLCE